MKKIERFGFFALTASMVTTIYSYPAFASSGLPLLFFIIFGGIFFFIPSALVSAELATAKEWGADGVYSWCSAAFGKRWGFFAVFMQWFQITIGVVVMLYFLVGSLAYLLDMHAINGNPVLKFGIVTIVFWAITWVNLKGAYFTSTVSRIGFFGGVVLPIVVLFFFGTDYLMSDLPKKVDLFEESFFPDFSNISTLVILVSFMLAYLGIEASAVHIPKMADPKKDYPVALIFLAFFDIVIKIIGAMAIALVIPVAAIEMNAGVMQAFESYLGMYGLESGIALKLLALLLIIGIVSEIGGWTVGPIRGMSYAARDGIIPPALSAMNSNSVPRRFLILQAFIVTFWAAVLTFSSTTGNVAFLTAISVTVVTYLMMYALMFLAYFKLRAAYPDEKKMFVIPGGRIMRTLIPLCGLLVTLFAITVSFFPPSQILHDNRGEYEIILAFSFIGIFLVPHIIYGIAKSRGNLSR